MKNPSIIAEIFYGNRGNGGAIKESDEYRKILKESVMLSKELDISLNDRQKELLDEIETASNLLEAEAVVIRFVEGFKLGLLIGKEVFGE